MLFITFKTILVIAFITDCKLIGVINLLTNDDKRRKFLSKTPRFGRKDKPLPITYQQSSVYYWWWAYLKRNKRYLACCERGGKGRLAALYKDFGDVRSDDFKAWWTTGDRGAYLFAEPPAPIRVQELANKSEWDEEWTREAAMVVVVPLEWSKRAINKAFGRLLMRRHTRGRGRKPAADKRDDTTARYPLVRHFNVASLETALSVYEAVEAAKREAAETGGRRKTYYEIGVELRLVRDSMPTADELKRGIKDRHKANVMTVAVSRYYTNTVKMIENVARGRFPDVG